MIHALTVDVEDYDNVLARDWLDREVPPSDAVVLNTRRFLTLLAHHNVRATFFILGEVAEAHPQLVRDIADRGHELGVHGYHHRQVFRLTPEEFRREVGRAKSLVEDLGGAAVQGHRAPAFSITPDTRWALGILAETGFRYDSSVFPIAGRRYGWPGFPPGIHEVTLDGERQIVEAPMSTVSVLGRRLPVCGGGYVRHFPYAVTRWAMRRVQRERPAIVYVHPYDIEVTDQRLDTSGLEPPAARRARRFHRWQTRNRHTVEGKILRLLHEFEFAPLREVVNARLDAGRSRKHGTSRGP